MRRSRHKLLLLALASAAPARAGELTVHVGPPQVGSGGSNPVSIPPVNPLEYEVEYATNGGWEGSASVAPGLLIGRRSTEPGNGVYVSLGGGAILDANGAGPGAYASLGYDAGKTVKYNVELKQAAGYDFQTRHYLTPYAIRMGVAIELGGGGARE